MSEWKLFRGLGEPECTTAQWYQDRERAPHLEQPGHRDRLLRTEAYVRQVMALHDLGTVSDVGCGDGGLLSRLKDVHAWGYDLCPANVESAKNERQVDATLWDAVRYPDQVQWGDLTVATEMLEHLADPHAFVREIGRRSRALVASSPAFENAASHYEFHTWAWDMDGYAALIRQGGFEITDHTVICGFQILAALRP